jgi:hypothetical protein
MRNNPKHSAFTLLEVILALGLSTLVLMLLGMAINLHLRLLDSGRTKVEEAQLARAILRIIAQDLRSAVPYNSGKASGKSSSGSSGSSNQMGTSSQYSPSFSTKPSITLLTAAIGISLTGAVGQSNQGGNSGKGGGTAAGGGTGAAGGTGAGGGTGKGTATSADSGTGAGSGTGAAGSNGTSSTDTTDSEDRTSDVADAAVQSVPGLYGNANQLQVDISRLPRADQYIAISNQSNSGSTNADLVSDVKNVTYYVINNGVTPTPGSTGGATALCGLVRREMGRASGIYAAQQTGQLPAASDTLEPIAPEVQEINFLYSDGAQWLDTWDSVSNAGLPVAVQVSIVVAPQHNRNNSNLQANTYRLTVSIPAAKPAASQTTSTSQTSQ